MWGSLGHFQQTVPVCAVVHSAGSGLHGVHDVVAGAAGASTTGVTVVVDLAARA